MYSSPSCSFVELFWMLGVCSESLSIRGILPLFIRQRPSWHPGFQWEKRQDLKQDFSAKSSQTTLLKIVFHLQSLSVRLLRATNLASIYFYSWQSSIHSSMVFQDQPTRSKPGIPAELASESHRVSKTLRPDALFMVRMAGHWILSSEFLLTANRTSWGPRALTPQFHFFHPLALGLTWLTGAPPCLVCFCWQWFLFLGICYPAFEAKGNSHFCFLFLSYSLKTAL